MVLKIFQIEKNKYNVKQSLLGEYLLLKQFFFRIHLDA